jgi:PAS domain S-box-containing protein
MLDREQQLEAMNRVLRIAAHDNNLLRRETFEALARVLASYFPLDCLAVVVPEQEGKRLYAACLAEGGRALPPFGARFPDRHQNETVLKTGVIKLVDDTRDADDQIAIHWGFLSYAILPIRRRLWTLDRGRMDAPPYTENDPIVAKLIVAFRVPGYATKAPIDLLVLLSELFGETFERSLELTRERRLAMILETSGEAMLAWDNEGNVTDANFAAASMTGATRDALIGTSVNQLLDVEGIRRERSLFAEGSESARALRTTLTRIAEPAPTRGDAHALAQTEASRPPHIPVSVTMSSVEDDPLVAMHALLRDDSHLVAAEREAQLHFTRVRELEKELRAILDNAPLIIFRLDPKTLALKYLNRHAERSLGVPMSEALSTPGFLRAVHRDLDALDAFDAAVELARSGDVSQPYEARLQFGENEIAVRGTIYPLRDDPTSEVIAIEGILADVSAEHAARARTVQADRLSSLGLLAASVAHEINNPASFMLLGLGNMGRLLDGLVSGDNPQIGPARELLRELRDSLDRIVRIVRDLRVFASPSRDDPSFAVDVNEVVESALSLARGRIMERADLVKQLGDDLPLVLMDPGRLGQVIVNLLVNATQAIPREGTQAKVAVETRTRTDDGSVEIIVADTGMGIPKEILQRIWMPFFTTKSPEMGTGLGLSISREIVERAGGEIRVESRVTDTDDGPRGSRFVIKLPAVAATKPHEPFDETERPASTIRTRVTPRRNVLIVEDERPLAQALVDEIGRYHDVAVAYHGELALELLDKRRFDVVLCDLRMPGMSGEALYRSICERDPPQAGAFIFMSGIGFVPEVERFLAASGRPVLHKPFAPATALEMIASASAHLNVTPAPSPVSSPRH